MLTVAFKWLHGFNYSFHNKQLCEHLFKELKAVPHMEFAAELSLPLAISRKQMEMAWRTYEKSTTHQKNLKGTVVSARKRKNKTHTHTVFVCEIEKETTEVIRREAIRSPAHANPLFVLGCQGFPADLFRFVIIFLRRFWVCLHVSAVEAEKREEGTLWDLPWEHKICFYWQRFHQQIHL